MNEAEKERLIKKDIESIENRVRHAFNQGYEMGMKESRSEIPTSCGDAISRQTVEKITWEEPTFTDALNVLAEVRDKVRALPSVSPQQRTGRWVKTRLDDEPDKICDDCGTYCWKCSICGSDASGWGNYKYCPKCGCKMEVEEC